MDFFGIGAALRGAATVYFLSARASGRTKALIDVLQDGDRVCFASPDEARRVKHTCLERGVQITTEVVDPRNISGVAWFEKRVCDGRYFFDHSWVEDYYMKALNVAEKDIDDLQKALSLDKRDCYSKLREGVEGRWIL